MARFPIIDSPCPLSQSELAGIAGHCGRCSKTVHSLDGMDDAGRAALMRQAKGPVCVSYRLPIGASAALALSLVAPVMAHDAPSVAPVRQAVTAPVHVSSPVSNAAVAPASNDKPKEPDIIVLAGGVHVPSATRWTEDLSLPELPTASDDSLAGPAHHPDSRR